MAANTYVVGQADAGRPVVVPLTRSQPRALRHSSISRPAIDMPPVGKFGVSSGVNHCASTISLPSMHDLARAVLRAEAHHQLVREGPRLAAAELDVADREADLLA